MNGAVLSNTPMINSFAADSDTVGDALARSNVLRLSGTAMASSIVSLFDGASFLGLTKADARGAWNFVTETLPEGTHRFTASATDADGNKSDLSGALTVAVDVQAPAAPINASILSDIDSGNTGTDGSVLMPVGSAETESSALKIADAVGDISAASGLFTVNNFVAEATVHENFVGTTQAPGEGHFLVSTVGQVSARACDAPAPTLGNFSDAVSSVLPVHSLDASGSSVGGTAAFTLDSAPTVTVADNTSGFATGASVGTVAQPASNTAMVIDAGATQELADAYSGTVSFAGTTGTLIVDHSSSFSGTITGQLGIGNVIDLADITAGPNLTMSYSGNNSPGTLTVSDGTHTANIALDGNYSLANFTAYSDGHGGTSIVDPPAYVGTGLDANGFTTFTPSADTRIIYVSSSTGNDSNNGLSPNSAVATIAEGLSLIRDGSADHLLLKAGDTFVDQSFGWLDISGRSATEPIVISSYGSGPRPIIETPANSDVGIGTLTTALLGVTLR